MPKGNAAAALVRASPHGLISIIYTAATMKWSSFTAAAWER
jgi:hypothetical protein